MTSAPAPVEDEQVFTRRSSRITTPASIPIEEEPQFTPRRGSRTTTAAPTAPEEEQVFTRRSGRVTTVAPAPVQEETEDDEEPPKLQEAPNARRPETTKEIDEEEGMKLSNA